MVESKLKVLELFAGIGACSKALTNLGIEHEIVDAVEIDKYAVKSFNAIHGTNFEPQDITKWDKDIECDLIMHGSPCQDFSVAGKNAGGDKDSGTRSSLMYETLRIVEKLHPKYVIWENVKNLLSKKHRHNFDAYLEAMERLGYHSQYQVLNAKDYGVPQNRERVFTVSIRGCIHSATFLPSGVTVYPEKFEFPPKQELTVKLKDILEDEVDEKYYLSDEQTARLRSTTYGSRDYKDSKCVQVAQLYGFGKERNPQAGRVYDQDGICPTMSTMQGGNQEPKIVTGGVQIVDDIYKNRPPRFYGKTALPIKRRRSEFGKMVRKQYDNHELPHDESMREYYLDENGIMSALTVNGREQKVAELNVTNKDRG